MKIMDIIKKHYATIAIILVIALTAALSFFNRIPQEDAMNYLLCADVGLALNILLSSVENDKRNSDIFKLLQPQSTSKKVTRKEHYELLNTAINNAASQVCIMTVDSALKRKVVSTIPERQQYYQNLESVVKKGVISVRRIYGLPSDEEGRKDKIEWIKEDLEKYKNCTNYQMRIFDWRKFESIPTPLSLQIVDNTFVGLVNMQNAGVGVIGEGEDICIFDPNVVDHLQLYYDEIWRKCEELKTGNYINGNLLVI